MAMTLNHSLAVYYLRLGTGFYTLWQAWDIIVHQSQWRAYLSGFPLVGVMSEFWLILGFVVFLLIGLSLITGWYARGSAIALGVLVLLMIIPFGFLAPKVNAVLGPFRALAAKNIVWLGACLVLITQPKDPYNPERRYAEGFPEWKDKAHLVFRLLLGTYLIWDGLLLLLNSNGYMSLTAKAMDQIPLFTKVLSDVVINGFAIISILAGVMIMSGVQFRWALWAVLVISLIHLIGINWYATKGLLRAGGRFMMRDIIIISSYLYFMFSGPGMPVLKINIQRASQSDALRGTADNDPPQSLL